MQAPTRVKICGFTQKHDIDQAVALGADAIGCICTPQSPRHRTPQQISRLFADIPPFVTRVVVVVDPDTTTLHQLGECPIDYLQFHGNESPKLVAQSPHPWYKAVRGTAELHQLTQSYPTTPAVLVDAPGGGGKGDQWDWSQCPPQSSYPKPLIIAGGLNPANVAMVIRLLQPWAVDVASGVERTVGVKDYSLMQQFMRVVRSQQGSVYAADDA